MIQKPKKIRMYSKSNTTKVTKTTIKPIKTTLNNHHDDQTAAFLEASRSAAFFKRFISSSSSRTI